MEKNGEPVLTVHNRHLGASGQAPGLETKDHWYTAYFENSLGEQLVFQYDRLEKKGWLWQIQDGDCPAVVLDSDEREWLRLVWRVATAPFHP